MNNQLYIVGIIPARMRSSRFPGKPLATIQGIPMVGHVFFRSKMCKLLNSVYVATCDQEIADYIESVGGNAIMTADTHERATDRSAEALKKIEKETKEQIDIVVMIQGDEPMLTPQMIEDAVSIMVSDNSILLSSLMASLKTEEEFNDRNEIKVVVDREYNALYFSREPIPSQSRDNEESKRFKQLAIISFRRDFLLKFSKLEPTPLEIAESIDVLRALEHGYAVKMVSTNYDIYHVDTEQDRQRVDLLMENDNLLSQYI